MVNPEIIFADEPTGNLDSNTSKEIMNLMQSVVREQNQTLIMVTHDNQLASFADRIIRIVDGKIVDMIDNTNKEQKSEKTEHKDNGQENNTVPENASDSVTMEERGGQATINFIADICSAVQQWNGQQRYAYSVCRRKQR